MARVTVEDCLQNVENRFDLVLKAAARAHALEMGVADAQVSIDNDKPTVIALREIAKGVDFKKLNAQAEAMNEAPASPEEMFRDELNKGEQTD